ncbi:MAG: hypothetical protein HYR85_27380, partial [Planctomycetes bacterium]|nr:hypothetical protein [Planctomycetota bacterium]
MRLLAIVTCVVGIAAVGCDRGGAPPTDPVFTFAAGSKVPGYVSGRGFGSVRDVDTSGTLDARTYAINDSIPGQVLRFPTGSRSDVRAIGDFADGVWTVTFERALATSDPADVAFAPGGTYYFQVATFDDENGAAEGRGMTATSLDVYSIVLPATPGPITVPTVPANLDTLGGDVSATTLRLTATFRDRNRVRNDRPRPWIFDGTTWRRGSGDEDRLAFYWSRFEGLPLGFGPGTSGTGRCAEMCHTGVGEWTLSDQVDSWEWSAGSTNPLGVALDGFVDATVGLGRHADAGDGTTADNVDASGSLPASEAADFPGVGSSSLIETAELTRRGVPFATGGPYSRGDTIPGFVNLAATGSRADVRARSSFKNGVWTLTLERRLRTNDLANDVQFDPGNTTFFQVAIFDNEPGSAEAIGMTSQSNLTYSMTLPATPGAIRFSSTPAKLTSLTGTTTANSIQITASWVDVNRRRNVTKGEWRFDGSTWTRAPASEDEDGFAIYFAMQPNTDIGLGPGTTGTGRCVEMCHTGIAEWTAAGKLDAWRWSALRTDPTGTLEDTFVDSTVGGGRHPDAGDAGAIVNDDGSGTLPAFAPEPLTVDHADAIVIGPSGTTLPPAWQPAIPFAQPIWTVTFTRAGHSTDPTRDVPDFMGTHFFQVATFDDQLGIVQDLPHTQYGTRT